MCCSVGLLGWLLSRLLRGFFRGLFGGVLGRLFAGFFRRLQCGLNIDTSNAGVDAIVQAPAPAMPQRSAKKALWALGPEPRLLGRLVL